MSHRSLFPSVVTILLVLTLLANSTNAMDEGQRFFTPEGTTDSIGVYVYKSVTSFDSHIKAFIEPNAGAHYYVQSKYSSDYRNLIGVIDVNSLRMNLRQDTSKNRTACISLNVLTDLGALDIGIENEGNGWFAIFYAGHLDKSSLSSPYNQTKTVYPAAKKVEFSIEAKIEGRQDKVVGYFRFLDGNGSQLGTKTLTFYVPQGQLYPVDSAGRPILRFGRFMSLLPYGLDGTAAKDVTDLTYMRNAKFTNLQLYHRTLGYRVWSMSRIDYAWSVQTANIQNLQISYPSNGASDYVSLYHQYDYHN